MITEKEIAKCWEYADTCTKAMDIIKKHKLLNYVIKNKKCASMYKLTDEEIKILKKFMKVD